jgi:succinate dehydrogenase / fumarate reductase cytochrome b subunit
LYRRTLRQKEFRVTKANGTSTSSNDYVLRRLHSLSGIFPIGVFLISHLITNAMITLNTPETDQYQGQVDRIHALGPYLLPVEILFIFAPLAFHAGLGLKIWMEGKSNVRSYSYLGNFRYMLQRITGGIALLFIVVHIWHMHKLGSPFGGAMFDPHEASATAAYALQAHRGWTLPVYIIGILATCYHLANGIWTALISWGVTIGPGAQRKMGYLCTAFGLWLAATGLAALNSFMKYEDARPKAKPAETVNNISNFNVSETG